MAATDLTTEAQIDALAAAIVADVNGVRAKIGTLTSLSTTAKTNLVAAINEIYTMAGGAGSINDGTTGTGTTWSSTKIAAEIAALVASAPAVLNTLDELANALGDDPNFATTMATALGNRLRVDAAQGLNGTQQAQGRSNLGIVASTANFASAYNTAVG